MVLDDLKYFTQCNKLIKFAAISEKCTNMKKKARTREQRFGVRPVKVEIIKGFSRLKCLTENQCIGAK